MKVFEITEEPEVDNQGCDEKGLSNLWASATADFPRDGEVDKCRACHQKEEAPVPPSVKKVAGGEEKDVLLPAPEFPIDRYDKGQKDEEDGSIEKHYASFARSRLSANRLAGTGA
jgi:hypothetical protein